MEKYIGKHYVHGGKKFRIDSENSGMHFKI